jgi:hypothetical protein
MRKVAFDHCAKEKAAVEGYSTEDLFRYSIPKIKALLPDVFDYSDWQSFGLKGDGQPGSKPQANQTGDRMVELIDIKAGVGRLPVETKDPSALYLAKDKVKTIGQFGDDFIPYRQRRRRQRDGED